MGDNGVNQFKKETLEGVVFKTINSGDAVVVQYLDAKNIIVKFLETGTVISVPFNQLKRGEIRDTERASVYGVGICDVKGKFNGKQAKEYLLWYGLLKRCFSKRTHKLYPSYGLCTPSDNFKRYSYFKDWCQNQVGFDQEGWELDKDILVKGNKVYSEDTCCFVPRQINSLVINRGNDRGKYLLGVSKQTKSSKFSAKLSKYGKAHVLGYFNTELEAFYTYKEAKEDYIKEVANKWKDKIDPRVYEALMNWVVEITD